MRMRRRYFTDGIVEDDLHRDTLKTLGNYGGIGAPTGMPPFHFLSVMVTFPPVPNDA